MQVHVVPAVFVKFGATFGPLDGETGLSRHPARCRVYHRMPQFYPVEAHIAEGPPAQCREHQRSGALTAGGRHCGVQALPAAVAKRHGQQPDPSDQFAAAPSGHLPVCAFLGHPAALPAPDDLACLVIGVDPEPVPVPDCGISIKVEQRQGIARFPRTQQQAALGGQDWLGRAGETARRDRSRDKWRHAPHHRKQFLNARPLDATRPFAEGTLRPAPPDPPYRFGLPFSGPAMKSTAAAATSGGSLLVIARRAGGARAIS